MVSLALTGTSEGDGSPFAFIIQLLKGWTKLVSRPTPTVPPQFEALFQKAQSVLDAKDLDDVGVRLEVLVPYVVEAFDSITSVDLSGLSSAEIFEEPSADEPLSRFLGVGVSRQIHAAVRDLFISFPRVFDAVRDLVDIRIPQERRELIQRFFSALGPTALQDGLTVPHALVLSTLERYKGTAALVAVASATLQRVTPDRWLGKALADAATNMASEFAWSLATAGYPVEGVRTREPADLAELFRATDEADAAFLASIGEPVSGTESLLPFDER